MPFSADNPQHLGGLLTAVEQSKKAKKPFEEVARSLLGAYLGEHYGEESKNKRPINMTEFITSVFLRGVASHAPQAQVASDYTELLPYARDMELALNQEIKRLNLRDAINTCALQSMFSMGVMEVGITAADTPPNGEGYLYDPGHLFADPILFEDLILDMSAKHWDQQGYIGHEFTVPLEWAKENSNFEADARKELVGDRGDSYSPEVDSNSASITGSVEEFEETIRLRQLFLPRYQLILLFACDKQKPLQIIEWKGPEKGPYHCLSFGKVPGNLIPLAPALTWFDLDSAINECAVKVIDQALAQKTGVGVRPHQVKDGQTIVEMEDGQVIVIDDPKIAQIAVGGADQRTLGVILWFKDILNTIAGNPEMLAGTGPQSRTVGQDQLIAQNASGRLQDMQDSMREFQASVVQDMAFWMWQDPISEWRFNKPVGDGRFSIPAVWSPETRSGEFFQYNFSVNAYREVNRSPSEQGAHLLNMLQSLLLPIDPLMQAQGKALDWEAILKTVARLTDTPEMNQWIQHLDGEQYPSPGPVQPRMPANTHRTYERVNRPGATQGAKDTTMSRLLFGDNPQGAEMGALMRSAG